MGERHEDRFNAIMDLIGTTDGKATAIEIDVVARMADRKSNEEKGNASENKFMFYAVRLPEVVNLRNASAEEIYFLKIDKWITFDKSLHLPELPVQIKSSRKAVNIYKEGDPETGKRPRPEFIKLNGIQIVINCGKSVGMPEFKSQMTDEIQRITNALHRRPTLIQAIEKINQR